MIRRSQLQSCVACVILALVTLSIAAAIEIQNRRAGSYLPRDITYSGQFSRKAAEMGNGKWRVNAEVRDERDGLRDLVSSLGLAQYLLVPLLAVGSGGLAVRAWPAHRRVFAASCLCFAVAQLGALLMVHREYATSLGW